jgi:hypothetical protein
LDARNTSGHDEEKETTQRRNDHETEMRRMTQSAARESLLKPEHHSERTRALRFGADRICLWVLCPERACRRATACRGDVRACAGRVEAWLAALEEESRVRPDFAEIEWRIASLEELRAYRAWRKALPARR